MNGGGAEPILSLSTHSVTMHRACMGSATLRGWGRRIQSLSLDYSNKIVSEREKQNQLSRCTVTQSPHLARGVQDLLDYVVSQRPELWLGKLSSWAAAQIWRSEDNFCLSILTALFEVGFILSPTSKRASETCNSDSRHRAGVQDHCFWLSMGSGDSNSSSQ